MMYTKHQWNSDVYYNFPYVKYLPKNFNEGEKYPLVFFLHGAGERGDDPDVAVRHGYMKYVREEGRQYPFIFIAPQCPKRKYWGCYTESLLAFLDYVCETLPIDRTRIYLTGLSMGGTGSWMLAMADPDRFAAVVPICGSGICWNAECLKNLPIYAYHGDADPVVPVHESVSMVSQVNKKGGNAQLKILSGVGHNAWEIAYQDDELLNWMLKHKQTPPEEDVTKKV